ncbi:DUF4349 domain-containing protein [Selenihalanaerobacter shriftii]|uniref:DUF4349 domain-containing protein n=1 Tax=Selenihalanaerobacter shriftii TaxID=142842 RepID=A0A1T4PTI7_9FIRM|nr:DUF4349 domain-containing protein [Selenihalanaerobacter shriftii]SJZ94840.1 protein of unknown function [Selenihalanaerobacter shriftii]
MSKRLKLIFLFLLLSLVLITSACQPQTNTIPKEPLVKDNIYNEKLSPQKTKSTRSTEIIDRKIIKTANIRLETENVNKISRKITELIKKYNGYLASSRQWQDSNQRKSYHYKIRISQQNFQAVLSEIKTFGRLKNEQIRSEDITLEYIDLKARLKNLKAQEKKYLKLLNKAEKVEAVIKVEKELNRVRTNIEQLQGKLNYYNNKIDLATIDLYITQPQPIINNNWGILQSFKRALSKFIGSINAVIIFIGEVTPWIIFLFIIGFLLYKLFTFRRK